MNDREEFLSRVTRVVEESLHRVYDSYSSSTPLVFTEPKPAHEELVKDIFLQRQRQNGGGGGNNNSSNSNNNQDKDDLLVISSDHFEDSHTGDGLEAEGEDSSSFSLLGTSSDVQIADLSSENTATIH
jgi:hypothetical protein